MEMKYFLVSKDEDGGLTLESFEARNTKEALLHVVDAWNWGGFSKDKDYQECKGKSVRAIGEYLAKMNTSDEVIDLALFREGDVSEFGKGSPRGAVWSIFDYVNASKVF